MQNTSARCGALVLIGVLSLTGCMLGDSVDQPKNLAGRVAPPILTMTAVDNGCERGRRHLGLAAKLGEAAGHEGDEGLPDVGFGVGHLAFVVPHVASGPHRQR